MSSSRSVVLSSAGGAPLQWRVFLAVAAPHDAPLEWRARSGRLTTRRSLFRISALLLALFLPLTAALAQAPSVEPGTKLSFPPTLGGATLVQSASKGGGSSYQYSVPNGMEIIVDIYGSSRRAPNGSSHPAILNQFNDELSSLAQQAASAGLSAFEKPAVPSACTYGPYTFRCTTFGASGGAAGRISGKILLIGYREHFLKIVINWMQKGGQTAADADKALNAFVPALMSGR